MIVSHKHKFIFIKNRKVAGTSVEKALAGICGPDDILSSGAPERNRVGRNKALAEHARNYEGTFSVLDELMIDARPSTVVRVLRDRLQRHRYYNHMRATSIKARLGADLWDNYYKFCFERNPWDKMVSFYYWYNRSTKAPKDINTFICSKMSGLTADQKYPTDWERYTLRGKLIVDDVFDYGDLSANLVTALRRAGVDQDIAESLELPRFKAGVRPAAPETLSHASDKVIRRVFSNEISEFGYSCPDGLLEEA